MKTQLIALTLIGATAAAVAWLPAVKQVGAVTAPPTHATLPPFTSENASIEVVFVLDTTGSMSGMIDAAKEKIWSIAASMASANSAPRIKMGLVAYRDRGDDYVTRVIELSDDLDSVYAKLMDLRANGGGDGPESVNQALYEAVHDIGWSRDPGTYRTLFLVGDAPPHMDYQADVPYAATIAQASRRGIVVNTIQCGNDQATTLRWQEMAGLGQGRYFKVDQNGGAVAIATPYDTEMAALSRELDETRLYYGTEEERERKAEKVKATDKLHAAASVTSRARRAAFNASESGKANLLGESELVEDVATGRVDLSKIEEEKLPEPLQAMAPSARQAVIEETMARRDALQLQIRTLADQRAEFLKKQTEASGGAEDSLDYKLFSAVREQAKEKGIEYGADALEY